MPVKALALEPPEDNASTGSGSRATRGFWRSGGLQLILICDWINDCCCMYLDQLIFICELQKQSKGSTTPLSSLGVNATSSNVE